MNIIDTPKIRSISPSVMRNLTPTRNNSKALNYHQMRKKIAAISKSVFKTNSDQHPILSLEKAVLRGKGTEKNLKTSPLKSPKPTLSKLEELLKKEHKINSSGTQIVRLPKLPFAQHQTYNEEKSFVDKHFVHERSESVQIQELSNLSRKFKLSDRIRSKRKHAKPIQNIKAKNPKDEYDMEGGKLIVNVESDIIDSYEADKSKYVIKHHYAYQTFRKVDLNCSPKLSRDNTLEKIDQADFILRRLYKAPEKVVCNLDRELTIRYPGLFEI